MARRAELTVALVREALARDRSAIRVIVDALTPVIQARAARALLRRGPRDVKAEVEDITQNVLGALFARGGGILLKWDPALGLSLENFVGMRTEQEVASIMRSRIRNPLAHDPTPAEEIDVLLSGAEVERGPEVLAASRELLAAVLERMRERLSERGRELFELLVVEERPAEEVSALSGLSIDAIYQWRTRLGRLARHIAGELMSEPGARPRNPSEVPAP